MSTQDRVPLSRPGAAWLPTGGRAEVVLAASGSVPPSPTCVVRLLATLDDEILTEPRADGKGLDIPTAAVSDEVPDLALRTLVRRALGGDHPVALLGFVRNVVPDPTVDYPWPAPLAHFAVWHCALARRPATAGRWLGAEEARDHLSERHWWPLMEHVPPGAGGSQLRQPRHRWLS